MSSNHNARRAKRGRDAISAATGRRFNRRGVESKDDLTDTLANVLHAGIAAGFIRPTLEDIEKFANVAVMHAVSEAEPDLPDPRDPALFSLPGETINPFDPRLDPPKGD